MKNFISLLQTVILFSLNGLLAEPFLSPHDLPLRHEIRLLQDRGVINSTINTWPLNLGGLDNVYKNNIKHNLLADKISKEQREGLSKVISTISISDNSDIFRPFGNRPRARFSTGLGATWMNDRYALKLSLQALDGVNEDYRGLKKEGLQVDGSYMAMRLANWSASIGKVDRWWGPGWDGNLILSNNARPIPAISLDRRISVPFENKWLSWIGPWSLNSFIGMMEEERTIPNCYLWGIRTEFKPEIISGLEIGLFRMMQLGGEGRKEDFKTFVNAFLSQDNYHHNNLEEPGNQLAGIDLRYRPGELPIAFYTQIVGDDEDKFLPNALFFQYGLEIWLDLELGTLRGFIEYNDLTSRWWTGDPRKFNITYEHGIYLEGYRYLGRAIGHWADTDSKILSLGSLLQLNNDIAWGSVFRFGDLNSDGNGRNSVSNAKKSEYAAIEVFNSRSFDRHYLKLETSLGWEEISVSSSQSDSGFTFSASVSKHF